MRTITAKPLRKLLWLAAPATALAFLLPGAFCPDVLADAAEASAGSEAQLASASDWPQFRGPRGDGKVSDGQLDESWPADGPKKLWSVPLGGGYSAISAVGGMLYTLASDGESEHLLAFDAATGKELWRHRTDDMRPDRFGDGPRSTPVIDGDRVYAVSALGHLWCLNKDTGEPIWDVDLRRAYGATVPTWGVSASPLVHGEKLLFDVGGKAGHAIMAFHKATGEVIWHVESGLPGYSLPLRIEAAGREQVVFFTGKRVLAVNPDDGEVLWQRPWSTAYDVNAASPVDLGDGRIFVSSGYDTGAAVLRVVKKGDGLDVEEVWESGGMKNQFSSSIYHDGYLYGFHNKILQALDARTGEVTWRQRGLGHGSLLYVDGHLLVLSEKGELLRVKADPKTYRQDAEIQVARGKHWTVPTYYGGRLYVRNEKELISFDV